MHTWHMHNYYTMVLNSKVIWLAIAAIYDSHNSVNYMLGCLKNHKCMVRLQRKFLISFHMK